MASDWIILGALVLLAAVVYLFVRTIADDADAGGKPQEPAVKRRDRAAKGAGAGH